MIGRFYVPDEITVRVSWLLPALTVPLAMVIHLLNGNSRDFPIFISEADYPGVERWVFTIGLALSGIIQMIFSYRMWLQPRMLDDGNSFILVFYVDWSPEVIY